MLAVKLFYPVCTRDSLSTTARHSVNDNRLVEELVREISVVALIESDLKFFAILDHFSSTFTVSRLSSRVAGTKKLFAFSI